MHLRYHGAKFSSHGCLPGVVGGQPAAFDNGLAKTPADRLQQLEQDRLQCSGGFGEEGR